MAQTVNIKVELLRWALARSGLKAGVLQADARFKKLDEWLDGTRRPTLRQLEHFAARTMTPLGYLLLEVPPDESLPIPDFRTRGDVSIERPSPNLIEMIQTMQRRQAWMREYLIDEGHEPLDFVGSARSLRSATTLAARIRARLGLEADWAEQHRTWEEALRALRRAAEGIGVMVATASVVGLNNRRGLDPDEFRGFVLCDDSAPLVFVNGADSKSAQMFTLAHELVHVWLGRGGLFNLIRTMPTDDDTERFCNQTAAEFLLPGDKLRARWADVQGVANPFKEVARWFKVSPVAAARRALDLRLITRARFFEFYEQDQAEFQRRKGEERAGLKKGHPDFYVVQDVRLGRRFAQAVVRAAREGRLLYREAYQLTDLKGDTFAEYARRVHQRTIDERQ